MSDSLQLRLRELEEFRDGVLAGNYPQRTALGPGVVASSNIKSKSITASLLSVDSLSSVSASTGTLSVTGTITLGSGGKIIDADGSFWDQTGITLISSGAAGDNIIWKNGASTIGYVSATPSLLHMNAQGGFGVQLGATSLQLGNQSPSSTTLGPLLYIDTTPLIQVQVSAGKPMTLQDTNGDTKVFRRLSVGNQTTRYIDDDATDMVLGGGNVKTGAVKSSSVFYPNNQTTRYLGDDGTRLLLNGAVLVTGNLYPGNQTTRFLSDDGTFISASNLTAFNFKQGGGTFDFNGLLTTGLAAGVLPNPTKALQVNKGATAYFIPVYTATGTPWVA